MRSLLPQLVTSAEQRNRWQVKQLLGLAPKPPAGRRPRHGRWVPCIKAVIESGIFLPQSWSL